MRFIPFSSNAGLREVDDGIILYIFVSISKFVVLPLDPHVGVDAQEDGAVEESTFAKVEERIGAIPSGSTTDAELVERFLSSFITFRK